MNRRTFLAAIPVLALFTIAAVQQDGLLLRRELKEGAQDSYRIDIKGNVKMTVPGMGDQEILVNGGMDYLVKLGKVDAAKGSAAAEFLTSNVDFKAEGPLVDMMGGLPPMPKEAKAEGTVDVRGRVAQKAAGMSAEMMMLMGPGMSNVGQGIEFPEKPVKVGDTWEVIIPKNPFIGDKESKLTAKLVGETMVGDVPAYEITLAGKVDLKPNMEAVMKAVPDSAGASGMLASMEIVGTMDTKSRGLFEKATGRLLSMETTIDNKESVSLGGTEIPMSGVMKISMKLKK